MTSAHVFKIHFFKEISLHSFLLDTVCKWILTFLLLPLSCKDAFLLLQLWSSRLSFAFLCLNFIFPLKVPAHSLSSSAHQEGTSQILQNTNYKLPMEWVGITPAPSCCRALWAEPCVPLETREAVGIPHSWMICPGGCCCGGSSNTQQQHQSVVDK